MTASSFEEGKTPAACRIDCIDPWAWDRHRQSALVLGIGWIASPCSRSSNDPSCDTYSMTLSHWSTSAGGFGAAAIAASSRGRATNVLVGASTASSVLSPVSSFIFAPTSTFPAITATATTAGVDSMACVTSVGSLLPVKNKVGDAVLEQP